ncbi:MAG: hypothetical protein ACYC6F_18415 [Longimicrobiales bacterium]
MTMPGHADDFDIGKSIFDQLRSLPPDRQQRVLRWVGEALGVTSTPLTDQTLPAAAALVAPAVQAQAPQPAPGPATDIKTFIAGKAPKSDQQFAAAVAYFYRFEAPPAERREAINGDLLQEAARLAGRKRFSNPRNTLNNAKGAGYLDGISPGEFSINSVGENLVAMTLPGGTESPARPIKRKPSTKRAKAAKKSSKAKRG